MGPILSIDPFMGGEPLMKGLAIVMLGGMGSVPGAVLGGYILGQVESFVTFFAGGLMGGLLFFLVIILILLVRPRGLFGYE